jgi:FkbM family methyltransferase
MNRRALNAASVALLSIVGFTAAFIASPKVRGYSLIAAGRSSGECPADALSSDQEKKRLSSELRSQLKLAKHDGNLQLWESPKGRFWIPGASGDLLAFLLAEQAVKIYGKGDSGVRAGDIVFDCGAHVGVYTREALSAGAKLVVAIEPAPANLECLRRNFASEIATGRVIVYAKGVWDKEDVLTFQVDNENSARNQFVPGTEGPETQQIAVTTIDKVAAELRLDRVDLIKMDIEGAEQKALLGGQETIRKHKPRLAVCVYHGPTDAEQVPKVIAGLRSDYERECGSCGISDMRLIPLTYLFR